MISRVSIKGLEEVEALLRNVKGGYKKASVRAINKGLAKAKTIAVDEIAKEVNLTKTVIRKTITERKATYTDPTCYLQSKDKRGVPLYDKTKPWKIKNQAPGMHFGGSKVKKGFTALFKKGRPRTKFPGAFVATMRNGHTNIFIRKGKGRTPIKGIWSSSPPQVLNNENRMGPVLEEASEAAQKELDRQVQLILSGAKV